MRKLWKRTGLAVTASVATSLVTMLGSVTHGDIVRYHDWIEPIQVKMPQIGQYYIIADDGTVKEPLCEIKDTDFTPVAYPEDGRRYVNWLGKATPFVVDAVSFITQPVQAAGSAGQPNRISYTLEIERLEHRHAPTATLRGLTRRILTPRDLDRIQKDGTSEAHREALRLSDCAGAIRASLESGFNVCQLNEVVRDGSNGSPLGVDFGSLCLARPSDTRPRVLPPLDRGSFWSDLKQAMDLLEVEPLS